MGPFDTLAEVIWSWVGRDRPRTVVRIWLERLGMLVMLLLIGIVLYLQFR